MPLLSSGAFVAFPKCQLLSYWLNLLRAILNRIHLSFSRRSDSRAQELKLENGNRNRKSAQLSGEPVDLRTALQPFHQSALAMRSPAPERQPDGAKLAQAAW